MVIILDFTIVQFTGDSFFFKNCLLFLVKCVRNKSGYFAEMLYESMKGLGTRDDDLIRILVSRHEIDLPQIKNEYKKLYSKSLYDHVKSETSGDYQKLLLTLIREWKTWHLDFSCYFYRLFIRTQSWSSS